MTELPNDTYLPETQNDAATQSVLILTADNTEDLEFFYPYYRFIEAGYKVDVATPDGGAFKGKQGLGLKETLEISEVDASDYALLYIPGGKAPAELQKDEEAVALVKEFATSGKPIAAICHGPQLLTAADVVQGRQISAFPEVEDELLAAGASYVSKETLTDGQFITARWPGDLPAHMKQTLQALNKSAGSKGKQRTAA